MMQLFRLALAAATIWGVSAIPFINAVKIGDKVSASRIYARGLGIDRKLLMVMGDDDEL